MNIGIIAIQISYTIFFIHDKFYRHEQTGIISIFQFSLAYFYCPKHYQKKNCYTEKVNFLFIADFFSPHLGSFCVVSSFTTFRPNFTSGLLQVILPRPRIGMLSLVTVSPVITAFHSCCLSHHVFDQVNLWPAWVEFETAIFWQCSPGTAETQRLYPLHHGPWKLPRWGEKKSAINKKLILRLRNLISKWFQLKTSTEKVVSKQ